MQVSLGNKKSFGKWVKMSKKFGFELPLLHF